MNILERNEADLRLSGNFVREYSMVQKGVIINFIIMKCAAQLFFSFSSDEKSWQVEEILNKQGKKIFSENFYYNSHTKTSFEAIKSTILLTSPR